MSFARKLYLSIFPTIFLLLSPTIHSAQKPWVAVHDFTASKNLNEIGITGWSVAGKLENELVQTGKFRLVVREKIGKVLKEKNVSSTSSLKPSAFGKMIGAEYIVTGSLTLRGKKLILIGKLIDVTKETGEVERSFDIISTGDDTSALIDKLPYMLDELAKKLSMSPGEFLDEGISYMNTGEYSKAVDSFKTARTLAPVAKIKKLMKDKSIVSDKNIDLDHLTTPGELLDYGVLMLNKNKNSKAITVFKAFEKMNPFKQIKELFEIAKLEKEAKNLNRQQEEKLHGQIKAAEDFIISVKESVPVVDTKIPEDQLCDNIIASLRDILRNPKYNLSYDERKLITKLISQLKDIKPYIVVEKTTPVVAVLPFPVISPVDNKNKVVKEINHEFGLSVTDNIRDYLETSRKFELIDNDKVLETLKKINFNPSDISNTREEMVIGKNLKTDYLITGYIEKESLLLKPANLTLRTKYKIYVAAKMNYHYKVLDIRRKKIIFAKSREIFTTTRNTRREISATELRNWTVIDYVNYITSKATTDIASEIVSTIFPSKISSVKDSFVTINKGSNSGIKIEDRFCIYNPGEKIVDPDTGSYLGDSIKEAGTVEVTNVHPMYSKAKIIEKKSKIKKGALCVNTSFSQKGKQPSAFKRQVNKVGGFFSGVFNDVKEGAKSVFN